MRARDKESGFTLVELLVSLTLFVLLAVILFGGLRFGLRAAADGTAWLDWSAEVAAVSGFLRTELSNVQPLRKGDEGKKTIAFAGAPDSLDAVVLPRPHLAEDGWHLLHLGVERDGNAVRLVATFSPVRTGETTDISAAPQRSVLFDHIASVDFAYFGALTEEETVDWHDHWQDAVGLPALVRLRLAFTNGKQAPDLVIALHAAAVPAWH